MTTIPRISTRGYYDLTSGKTIKSNRYFLYPKKSFDNFIGIRELTIMIHGLRNNNAGAIDKTKIAQRRLRQLGYKFPVIGYSYDSNTTGAHLIKHAKKALRIGQLIAKKNGRNLSSFIVDFKKQSPKTKIRLMSHSLGSQVILSTLETLYAKNQRKAVESVYFFGASLPEDIPSQPKYKRIFDTIVSSKIVNYYSPTDEVLLYADEHEMVSRPLGLCGSPKKSISKYYDRKVIPFNHRFASYAKVLKSYP